MAKPLKRVLPGKVPFLFFFPWTSHKGTPSSKAFQFPMEENFSDYQGLPPSFIIFLIVNQS